MPTTIAADLRPGGIELPWHSETNAFYHVEAKSLLYRDLWTNVRGRLTATSAVSVFVDTNSALQMARLYRIVKE